MVENGEACQPALERSVTLAETNQANLTVVDVVERVTANIGMPEGDPIAADLQAAMVSARKHELETLVDPYRKQIAIQTKVLTGTPFLELIREVLRGGRDLIIKMSENLDWLGRLFGGDDMHLLRKSPCAVWLIKTAAPKSYQRILAAVDVDDAFPPEELRTRQALNRQVLEMSISLALSESAELNVVDVWQAVGERALRSAFMRTPEEQVIAYVEQMRQHHEKNLTALMSAVTSDPAQGAVDDLKIVTHLIKGRARKEVPALATEIKADLIVMGTVARTGIPGLVIGNTAETILNQIDCSVLAIKPPGFKTPVTLDE